MSTDAVEASDTAEARGVNAWPSDGDSELAEVEGAISRMVDLEGEEGTSSSTDNPFSVMSDERTEGEDGGVLAWEKRVDEGEKDEAVKEVSASEVLVDAEFRAPFLLCWSGLGTRVLDASSFATALATVPPSETRRPLRSNAYPGALRGGKICDGWLGKGVFE